jgi:MFS family permease
VDWRLVFLVSVPFGVFGTVWAYLKLRELGVRRPARLDWAGNVTFGVGLIAVLVGITYGIQPYGGYTMGWTSPFVLTAIFGGLAVLAVFCVVETRVPEPMFRLPLFKIRAFTAGNLASLLSSLGRGGLMFVLIIWLQGIYLPRHGYSFSQTPLWAGIFMLPLTVGFLIAGPISGWLSDRFGARPFATGGMVVAAASFLLLELLPINFSYWQFAMILLLNGLGMGLFASPNRAGIMNSLPRESRGVGAGMSATFQNSAMVLSIGIFFTLIIAGLLTARRAQPRPGRPGRAAGRRGPGRGPAAGLRHVRGAARVQPDPDPARLGYLQAAGQPRRLPDRAQLLPGPDLAIVLERPVHRLRLRHRGLPRRCGRLAAARPPVRPRGARGQRGGAGFSVPSGDLGGSDARSPDGRFAAAPGQGTTVNGRIISLSSCSTMWQWWT